MAYAQNPILPGFNPDPSILRVGDDYYIATSTFEWFPGVQIHHSKDLVHWELITHPLNRVSQLNMLGNPSSGGVWAPCLSYDKGTFYLIFTDVKSFTGIFKDTHNYLVTADNIMGPWSEPIYLNSSGFDPSLFHNEDGKKWLVNMIWDYRRWKNPFGGIVLQEFSETEQKLVGDPRVIFDGTPLRCTEGPHLYKINSYYYLMIAEGGTGYNHAVTLARSKVLEGPYEVCPWNPILTSMAHPDREIQKAGHASLVEGANGRWYLVHLCGRPVGEERRCILGRETCIQEVEWENDWLRLAGGGNTPFERVEISGIKEAAYKKRYLLEEFDKKSININFQSLRIPLGERASLTAHPGNLRLYGKESLNSLHEQSLLALRQQDYKIEVTTKLSFSPNNFQQMAGLVYFYDTINYYYLYINHDEVEGRVLSVIHNALEKYTQPLGAGIILPHTGDVWLRLTTDRETAYFSYSLDGETYHKVGGEFDATVLSDDAYGSIGQMRFTGAYVGICCQDISGSKGYADFDYFEYKALE